jgi:hypothetical protein
LDKFINGAGLSHVRKPIAAELADAWRDSWASRNHGKTGINDDDVIWSHEQYPFVARVTTIHKQGQDTLHRIANIHTINEVFYI